MKRTFCISLLVVLCLSACHRNPHFITDREYRAEVHRDCEERLSALGLGNLGLDTLPRMEREAMEFLYAYMPLSDVADYEPAFFLRQVRDALRAREAMEWGQRVPEDVFRHFVLVYRVNNENLDTARSLFFDELRGRVQGMTMEEAALEVNHWCHENVAYRASDGRTSAPLATMRTSLGRCGEESTFAVTALRAVGIPARQCYTPRWAHCDDNHAWVEVWVDGEWKFMGACEPDPRLDMGWFSVPSTRCMMVHSKAFGKYRGDEEVVRRTGMYSELNLLSHYAPTRRVTVTVQDAAGRPAEGARVMFKLYNYAEYYTLADQRADAEGQASLTTGLGDLLIWVTDGRRFAFEKIDVRRDSTITLRLESEEWPAEAVVLEMVPPAEGKPKVTASEEETARNARRLAYEDSVRAAYVATFHSHSSNPFVRKSEGNWAVVERFVAQHEGCDDYLASFSDKDLRDIELEVLEAHLTTYDATEQGCSYEVYKQGLLPARISNERVLPYRKELAAFRGWQVGEIRQWVIDSLAVDDTSNYYGCPLSPAGVYRLRHADAHSRDIFFVAACRAAGVPAYLDNATNRLYAWSDGEWRVVLWSGMEEASASPAQRRASGLTLTYSGKDPAKPVYWPHFTLAKLEGGALRTFDFEEDARMASFPASVELEPGVYCLSTGNRYVDGAVRSRMEFFEVRLGQWVTRELVILPLQTAAGQMGKVDPLTELFEGIELWDYASEPGMLYVNLGNYGEPSKHLVVELKSLQKEVRQWGGMTFMVGPASVGMAGWGLANTDCAYQAGTLERQLLKALQLAPGAGYPLVVLIDKEGVVRYHSEGYRIGTVEQVLKAAKG